MDAESAAKPRSVQTRQKGHSRSCNNTENLFPWTRSSSLLWDHSHEPWTPEPCRGWGSNQCSYNSWQLWKLRVIGTQVCVTVVLPQAHAHHDKVLWGHRTVCCTFKSADLNSVWPREMFVLLNCLWVPLGAEFATFSKFSMNLIIIALINDNENKMANT